MGIEDKSKVIEQKEAGSGGKILTATIASWNADKGFGFLRLADGPGHSFI